MKVNWTADVLIGLFPGSAIEEKMIVNAEENDRTEARYAILREVYRGQRTAKATVTIRGLRMI